MTSAEARRDRLNQQLLTLAWWCQSRAIGEHDTETTLTMLERKVAAVRGQVDRAGWGGWEEVKKG